MTAYMFLRSACFKTCRPILTAPKSYYSRAKIKREARSLPLLTCRAALLRPVRSYEQGQEGEEHERFDERQAEQQHREYAAARSGIARRAFACGGDRAA